MKVALGCDHAGYILKDVITACLESEGHEVLDEGTDSDASCDWPDFGERVAGRVAAGEAERGIAICGTGIGMSITANKLPGVRRPCATTSTRHATAGCTTMPTCWPWGRG